MGQMNSRRKGREKGLVEGDEVALELGWLIFQEECLQVQILFNNAE